MLRNTVRLGLSPAAVVPGSAAFAVAARTFFFIFQSYS